MSDPIAHHECDSNEQMTSADLEQQPRKSRHAIDPNAPPTPEEIQAVRDAEKVVSNQRAESWITHPGDTMLYFVGSQEAKFWRYKLEEVEALVEMFS